jgi:hypothetical protein
MKKQLRIYDVNPAQSRARRWPFLAALAASITVGSLSLQAQCPVTELTSGLQRPGGIIRSGQRNLLVSETGTGAHDGRITIVDLDGSSRALLSGLPSGIADVGDPAGPAGLFLRGSTLYVAIGIGDAVRLGPTAGTLVPNPNGASSPIFSSVLAIQFGDGFVERSTAGFILSPGDQQALADGERVGLSNGGRDKITIEMVVNFPDFVANPLVSLPSNVRGSNPYGLVLAGDRQRHDREDGKDRRQGDFLYVTDGGRNLVWKVDVASGAFSILADFPLVPNPLAPAVGGPFSEAVPTGIAYSGGSLLVALFRGVPFAPGTSAIVPVDPQTGSYIDPLTGGHIPFITGLKTAIGVLPIRKQHDTDYLVLQHASAGPFFGSPGLLLRFEATGDPPTVIADCLTRPTAMTLDEKTGTLYVAELAGRIVAIPVAR